MRPLVIHNGRLLDPAASTDAAADLLIRDGRVETVAPAGTLRVADSETYDAKGLCVAPGFTDLRCHLREPGEEYEETIETGTKAAVAGGFTTVVAQPDTHPAIDRGELVDFVLRRGQTLGACRVLTAGALTVALEGKQLASFGELAAAGAVLLADGDRWVDNAGLMRRALEYALDYGLPVATHAEEPTLSHKTHLHEGSMSTRLGLRGQPRVAEDVALARDIQLAEYTGGRLHVAHVSTSGAVEQVRAAKARGVRVTAEVAAHHLLLTHVALEDFSTSLKVVPPLREESDRTALIAGLVDGTLDAIVSDHSPEGLLDKDCAFDEAAFGALGLQTAFSAALTCGLPLSTVIERLTLGPNRVLGRKTSTITSGSPADLVVFAPDATWTLERSQLASKATNSPFLGTPLKGRIERTLVGGRTVFSRTTTAT